MALLGIDLGGTKLAFGIFNEEGELLFKDVELLTNAKGMAVCDLLKKKTLSFLEMEKWSIRSIGISVPGIYHANTGTVWAPNIPGWEDFPLLEEMEKISGKIPVYIDSDRACCILGETWFGNAKENTNAIFLTVGTGISAGILIDGKVLRGTNDIAGAIGWMALEKPFQKKYTPCGCLEYGASGNGIVRLAKELFAEAEGYSGVLSKGELKELTGEDIFEAAKKGDEIAKQVIAICVEYWGMATANLISIFNPEKIIFGGGVFGPAIPLIPKIREEAAKWAQPVSMTKVDFVASTLGGRAALTGAACLSIKNIFI